MFDFCKKIDKECPFSFNNGQNCGRGKGKSLIDDIVSCNGIRPKYNNKFLDRLKLENINVRYKEKEIKQG